MLRHFGVVLDCGVVGSWAKSDNAVVHDHDSHKFGTNAPQVDAVRVIGLKVAPVTHGLVKVGSVVVHEFHGVATVFGKDRCAEKRRDFLNVRFGENGLHIVVIDPVFFEAVCGCTTGKE